MLRRRHELHLLDEVAALLARAAVLGWCTVGRTACFSGGSLGGGRLTALGPPALLTGLATFGFVAAGAVLWSLLVRRHADDLGLRRPLTMHARPARRIGPTPR